jgi:beta-glucanase (GH16 family)
MAADANLTGVWNGFFSYPRLLEPVTFTATLIETQSWVSGSTHEPCTVGKHIGQTLYATLLGTRTGNAVTFKKTYDGTSDRYHTVNYEGTIVEDGTEIEGRWIVRVTWSGRFLMVRSGHTVPAAKVKALARA